MSQTEQLLKTYRGVMKARGVTCKELASRLGVSPETIKRIFKSGRDTSLERLDKMCATIDISIEELVQIAKTGRTEVRLDTDDDANSR